MTSMTEMRMEYDALLKKTIEANQIAEGARMGALHAEKLLIEATERLFIVTQIYVEAQDQFSRLRKESTAWLTKDDVAELEKWIGRAHSVDGLKSILTALEELKRFKPTDIRKNLYALVQKIIIEGPRQTKG